MDVKFTYVAIMIVVEDDLLISFLSAEYSFILFIITIMSQVLIRDGLSMGIAIMRHSLTQKNGGYVFVPIKLDISRLTPRLY